MKIVRSSIGLLVLISLLAGSALAQDSGDKSSAANLSGSWFVVGTEVLRNSNERTKIYYAQVNFGGAGVFQSGRVYYPVDSSSQMIVSGLLSVGASGMVRGNLTRGDGSILALTMAHFARDHNQIVLYGVRTSTAGIWDVIETWAHY